MLSTATFAEIASLVGDPARANMLVALLDGRALTAKELAAAAGVTPQTASGHLARLTDAGLLAMERQGRHRYHRLASATVAHMLESIMSVAADMAGPGSAWRGRTAVVGPRDQALRRARTCYDHLAGELAVAMADRMIERGQIDLSPDGGVLTDDGAGFLRSLGIDLDAATARAARRGGGRVFCRPCLDWSERRPHIAGALGAALCATCLARGWLRRLDGTRAVAITPIGELILWKAFELPAAGPSAQVRIAAETP
jgi:DNA-binding transcriptional ArsR family regulator